VSAADPFRFEPEAIAIETHGAFEIVDAEREERDSRFHRQILPCDARLIGRHVSAAVQAERTSAGAMRLH
jgi:hypothetical protein